jgi:hypothetical protein
MIAGDNVPRIHCGYVSVVEVGGYVIKASYVVHQLPESSNVRIERFYIGFARSMLSLADFHSSSPFVRRQAG